MTDQPNIIFIITDQQRFDTIAALGFDYMDTPNLDRLVREGVSFSQCHVTAASCAPARASLFKGYYPHTTGILKNADSWRRSWIELLNDAGYHCTNVGKMHSWPFETPLGFDERYVVENKDRYLEGRYYFDEWDKALAARGLVKQQRELYRKLPDYAHRLGAFEWELPEDTHPDTFVGDMACWWIRNFPRTEPLFLQIGFPGPHPPYDPVMRYAEPYLKKDLPLLEVTQEELDNQPPAFKELRVHNSEIDHDSVLLELDPTQEQRHRQRAYYLANVTMIDEKVGQILEALEEKGYLENSVIIFTSDHGDCLTDHGHSQKWTMYDLITRIPLVVWAPNRFPGGRSVDGLCQQMDLGPTILELAGVTPPPTLEAKTMLPALQGESWSGRDYVYAEQVRDGILTGCSFMTMVRSQSWKLVHFLDEPHGQLFNLDEDPDEVKNLWDDPAHAGPKQELLAELREWRIRSGVDTAAWSAEWR
ncbi:sulfatase family protein [Lignipirellula cremea]|uniref:Arylsulfatase n=1 Tax=Lignipirellula cremea TaxID=2528010 RepID=A0A518DRV5_9BACT|nr:sulfatase-like hydrolase/transferase [Lignipirellula cremea]QDU94575.1 Arylsulfatase [Lignipirellula cremea]